MSLCPVCPRFLKNNSHVGEECGELLLQRGTTRVATGEGLAAKAVLVGTVLGQGR